MTEVNIDLKAKDQMSSVLDHVASRFGIATKAGLGMGLAFAGVNIAVGALQQAIGGMIDYVKDGVEANRAFELSMARLSNSANYFDVNMVALQDTFRNFSVMFATDLNTLIDGFRDFIREGFTASESLKLLFDAERLAVVTGDDLTTVQHGLITAMEVFGLKAGSSSDIMNDYNKIVGTTGLTIGDIDKVLGSAADSIRTSGVSFSDIVDILFTLESQGYNTRTMITKLKEILDTFPGDFKITAMPEDAVPDIETKFKKIQGTVQFTSDMMKQLGTISQMDLTGGLDISAMFSQEKIDKAQKYFDVLNSKGITTLKQFNDVAGQTAAKKLNPDFEFIGIDKQLWQLMRMYYQYNDMADEAAKKTETWQDKLAGIRTELSRLNTTLETDNATLAQTAMEIGDLTEMRGYTTAMHDATAAVQDQQDALKSLQRISDAYSLSQKINSLEISKIEYSAMGERHGLDRGQKEQIAALEKTNAGLQIQEQEQQIKISKKQQNGLQTAQDALDQVRRTHDEVMYSQQIRDLDENIKAKNAIYASTLQTITETNTAIAKQMDLWRNSELIKWVSWANDMHKWNTYAYSHDGKAPTKITTTPAAATTLSAILDKMRHGTFGLPHLATGGLVTESGAAIVHKDELIIPGDIFRNMPQLRMPQLRESSPVIMSQPGGTSNHVEIHIGTIHAEVKDGNVEEWGKKLGAGLSSGFLESGSSGTTTVTSRKTGASIVVPGTTVTTRTGRTPTATVPVIQNIKHKGRFRVG